MQRVHTHVGAHARVDFNEILDIFKYKNRQIQLSALGL